MFHIVITPDLQNLPVCLVFLLWLSFDTLSTLVEFVCASCLSQRLGFEYSPPLFFLNKEDYLSLVFQCWSVWFWFLVFGFFSPSFISAIQYVVFWKWITRHTVTYVIYNLLCLSLHQKLSCFQQSTSSNRTTDTSYEKIVLCSNSTFFQIYLLCNLVVSAGFLPCSLARKLIRDKKDDGYSDIFTVIYAQLTLLLISLSLRL